MDTRSKLLAVADAYTKATGRSLARIGTIINDRSVLFAKLAEGKTCTIETYDKAMQWFSDNWVSDLAWPDGVERPQPSAKSEEAA